MNKPRELKLAFIDIETTGLDIEQHEIIEIAALIYDPVSDEVLSEWERKIAPAHIETADNDALKINGYINNPQLYSGDIKSTIIKFNSLVRDCGIVGQNISEFDMPFISKEMKKLDMTPSWNKYRKIELLSMAWAAVYKTDIPGLSLSRLCDHFGISNIGAHSALEDCRRAYEVYKCLMKIYKAM